MSSYHIVFHNYTIRGYDSEFIHADYYLIKETTDGSYVEFYQYKNFTKVFVINWDYVNYIQRVEEEVPQEDNEVANYE